MILCQKTEIEPPSKSHASLNNWVMGRVQKKKIMSVDFSHAVFSLLFALGDAGLGGCAWSGSERSGLVWSSSALHIEFKMISHI